MKKIIGIILTFSLFISVIPVKAADSNIVNNKIFLNDDVLCMLGKTYSEVKEKIGKTSEMIWYDGPFFRFDNDLIYGFGDITDFKATEPADDAICSYFICSIDELIPRFGNKTYTVQELSELLNVDIHGSEHSEMYDLYYYTFEYYNLDITIHTENDTGVISKANIYEVSVKLNEGRQSKEEIVSDREKWFNIPEHILHLVGKNYLNIKYEYGEPDRWIDNSKIHYDEFDFDLEFDASNKNIVSDISKHILSPFSTCTALHGKLDAFCDVNCEVLSVDEFKNMIGVEVKTYFDETYKANYISFEYKSLLFELKIGENKTINADTPVLITITKSKKISYSNAVGHSVSETELLKKYREGNVVLPNGMERIPDEGFMDSNIATIVLPQSLKAIGQAAFRNCDNLQEVNIPYGTEAICAWAFSGCDNLKTVIIPSTVKRLYWSAFEDCPALENILYLAEDVDNGNYICKNDINIKNIIIASNDVNHVLDRMEINGNKGYGNYGEIDNLMILSDLEEQEALSHRLHSAHTAKNVFYCKKDNGYFKDFTKSNIVDNFDQYNFPCLEPFIEKNKQIKIYFNDRLLIPNQPPVIIDGRTFVTVRDVFEAMNMNVEWVNETSTILAKNLCYEIVMQIGNSNITINGETYKLDVSAQIINDRTMLPIRAIIEAVGGTVNWSEKKKSIHIYYNTNMMPLSSLENGSSVNFGNNCLMKNIQINKNSSEYKLGFDFYNFLYVPMQITVYDSKFNVINDVVTDSLWSETGYITEFKKTITTGQYMLDIYNGTNKENNYVIPYSEFSKKAFSDQNAFTVPINGYIRISYPQGGNKAQIALIMSFLFRNIAESKDMSGFFTNGLTPNNIIESVDWTEFSDELINNFNKDFIENLCEYFYSTDNIDEFSKSICKVIAESDISKICALAKNCFISSTKESIASSINKFFDKVASTTKLTEFVKIERNRSQLKTMFEQGMAANDSTIKDYTFIAK